MDIIKFLHMDCKFVRGVPGRKREYQDRTDRLGAENLVVDFALKIQHLENCPKTLTRFLPSRQ